MSDKLEPLIKACDICRHRSYDEEYDDCFSDIIDCIYEYFKPFLRADICEYA